MKVRRGWIASSPKAPFEIPVDVGDWLFEVFQSANRYVSYKLSRMPNTKETSLDDALLEALYSVSGVALLPSGHTVKIVVKSGGGEQHYNKMEIADIALFVHYTQPKAPPRTKMVLLQSKRLFPRPNSVIAFPLSSIEAIYRKRTRSMNTVPTAIFSDDSKYESISNGSKQQANLDAFTKTTGVPIYYLLYNPHKRWPAPVAIPVRNGMEPKGQVTLGCCIVPCSEMDKALASLGKGGSPSYKSLQATKFQPSWKKYKRSLISVRLDDFIANVVTGCHVGTFVESLNSAQQDALGEVMRIRIDGTNAVEFDIIEHVRSVISVTVNAPIATDKDQI